MISLTEEFKYHRLAKVIYNLHIKFATETCPFIFITELPKTLQIFIPKDSAACRETGLIGRKSLFKTMG